ncbi:EcsC family protein [Myxococcaceae bacterium GXIMD 01537]
MALFDGFTQRVADLRKLTPSELKRLAGERMSDLVQQEMSRARTRVAEMEKRYPSAPPRELAQRLIDEKKSVASMAGGISGVFGLISLPADLIFMAYLQLVLLVDVATVYKVNLKSERARTELLDLFGYANGLGPVHRASPKVLGKVAGKMLEKGGLHSLGKAVPLVAAPITAYMNNHHIQTVGEQAVRFYEGFDKAHAKAKAQSSEKATPSEKASA